MIAAQTAINQVERASPVDAAPKAPAGRLPLLAFVTDSVTETAISDSVAQLGATQLRVLRGGIDRAIQYLESERSPGMLIVDISGIDLPVSKVQELAEVCEPGVTVVAVGENNDIALYRDLIRAGISEYIVKPVTPQLLVKAFADKPGGTAPVAISQKLGKLIACTGARGGVGTTTVAVGLAWYLANQQSRRIALVDLDLQHGHCALALNLRATPGWREALTNPVRVDPVFLERIAAKQGDRLTVLSCEESLRDDIEITEGAVQTSLAVLRAQGHYVVVDVPRIAAAPYRSVLDMADYRVIVADQTLQSARDAARLHAALPEDATHRDLLVINRGGEGGRRSVTIKEMESVLELRPTVVIPYEPMNFIKALNAGEPAVARRGRFAAAVATLSTAMSGRQSKPNGWWRRRR